MLKESEPQNRMRNGSVDFVDTCRRGYSILYLACTKKERVEDGFKIRSCMTGKL